MYRLMLVDDEENILNALRRVLGTLLFAGPDGEKTEVVIETFRVPEKALERASYTAFDLVVSDYRMPTMNGVEFLKALKQHQPNIARLILSGYADLDGLIGAINEVGISRFIAKPWNDYELTAAITQQLAYGRCSLKMSAWQT